MRVTGGELARTERAPMTASGAGQHRDAEEVHVGAYARQSWRRRSSAHVD